MSKARSRYVAGIVYKGETPNADEIDLESLKGVLYEEAMLDLETCKEKLRQSGAKGKATIFQLVDERRS